MCTLTVNSIDDAIRITEAKLTKLGNPKIAFIGQRATDAFMSTPFVPIDLVICLDAADVGLPTISLEKKIGRKELWYSPMLMQLLSDPEIVHEISEALPQGSLIIPYASFPELQQFCSKNGYRLLGETYSKRSQFENKSRLVALKRSLTLPTTSTLVCKEEISYSLLTKTYGAKFVVQNANGSSGTGTFIIENARKFNESYPNFAQQVIVTEFHEGLTISVNFVVTDNQILTVCPSIQVIGQPELSVSQSTFCGVDFPLFKKVTTSDEAEAIEALVYKVAAAMQNSGYRGPANVNIMHSGLELTDINARFMGSGLLTTQSQIKNGLVPISLVHLMQFLGIDFKLSDTMTEDYKEPLNASMLVLHSLVETKQISLNAPIHRIFTEGSVLDLSGRLTPKHRNLVKEYGK